MDDTIASTRPRAEPAAVAELWRTYHADPSDANRNAVAETYIPLLWYLAGRVATHLRHHVLAEDLVGHGFVGLLAAIAAFDPSRGVKFTTYARRRICWAMQDGARSEAPVPRLAAQRRRRFRRTWSSAYASLGRPPTDGELAKALGMTPKRFQSFRTLADVPEMLSLDVAIVPPSGRGEDFSPADIAVCPGPGPSELPASADCLEYVLNHVSRRNRRAAMLYYGVGLTMEQVSKVLGISESAVSVRLAKARAHLRRRFAGRREELLDLLITRRAS